MSALVDASTPARWSGANTANGATFVSASFTPPGGSFLVVCVDYDTFSSGESSATYTPSGGGLTWTSRVERTGAEATAGGGSAVWTAPVVTGAAMTVTITRAGSSTTGSGRVSAKCYVVTGADNAGTPVDAVTASNEGGSATNSMTTTSVTPGANGLLFVTGTDWNTLGGGTTAPTSSDLTADAATYSGQIDVISGYKTCASGAGVTGNLDAAGTGAPQWKWCQITVRESGAAPAAKHRLGLLGVGG